MYLNSYFALVCLTQKHQQTYEQDHNNRLHQTSFRPPNKVQKPTPPQTNMLFRRNSTHIRISYRIHAHRVSMTHNKVNYISSYDLNDLKVDMY